MSDKLRPHLPPPSVELALGYAGTLVESYLSNPKEDDEMDLSYRVRRG